MSIKYSLLIKKRQLLSLEYVYIGITIFYVLGEKERLYCILKTNCMKSNSSQAMHCCLALSLVSSEGLKNFMAKKQFVNGIILWKNLIKHNKWDQDFWGYNHVMPRKGSWQVKVPDSQQLSTVITLLQWRAHMVAHNISRPRLERHEVTLN